MGGLIDSGLTTGLLGALGGAMTVLFGFWTQRKKSEIDESALVLGKWKELVDSHQKSIMDIRTEFSEYKRSAIHEIAELRERLVKAEHRIVELENENAGLKRAIVQNSKSTAYQLGEVRAKGTSTDEHITRVEGENSDQHDGFKDALRHLDNLHHNSRKRSEGEGDQ